MEDHELSSRHVRSNIAPLFFVIQNEQLILRDPDQNIHLNVDIGCFYGIFIVHFPKVIAANSFNILSGIMVFIYFITATLRNKSYVSYQIL